MDFLLPEKLTEDLKSLKDFLAANVAPHLSGWCEESAVPRSFFQKMGQNGWLGYDWRNGVFKEQPYLKQALLIEELGKLSPGLGVTVLVHTSLGTKGLALFGSEKQKDAYLESAIRGDAMICLGNTEPTAGSDVANVATKADRVDGGWLLNGTKSYVTNGNISDIAVVTAVSDPEASRNQRLSMFLVDLASKGVTRKKLHKQVWIPSDLTRLQFKDVFVPEENLLGRRGRGLQQVLEIFTHSRVTISALTLGTAEGAFDLALDRAKKREIFGKKIVDFQAKSFEIAHFYSKIEAVRLALWKTCWAKDQGKDFRLESSIAKYLAVEVAREVGVWAADLFGAASVIQEHPIHKFPMDAWGASLGEGTQDVQKLVIFREIMNGERAKELKREVTSVSPAPSPTHGAAATGKIRTAA